MGVVRVAMGVRWLCVLCDGCDLLARWWGRYRSVCPAVGGVWFLSILGYKREGTNNLTLKGQKVLGR